MVRGGGEEGVMINKRRWEYIEGKWCIKDIQVHLFSAG